MPNSFTQTKTLQDPIQINYVPVDKLLLDAENPRFAGLFKNGSESQILAKLKKEMHLDELIDSFQKNGYYNTEPLLVIEAKQPKGKFVVIEGNRRLAAIKTLLNSDTQISSSLKKQLTTNIPIAIYPNRQSLWTYLGFRHINGPQEWDSYSKAVYALRVNKEYKIPIEEIAKRIGDRHLTVVKMCNGLRVLEQAEKNGFFQSGEIELRRFYFSHLYTILQNDNTRKFLGIDVKKKDIFSENPIPKSKINNLKSLLDFLFGSPDGELKPVIKSQNPDLKFLDKVLGNKTALQYLKQNSQEMSSLQTALSYTDGEDSILEDLVYKSLDSLRKVNGYLYRYKENKELYKQIQEINQIVKDIVARVESKHK